MPPPPDHPNPMASGPGPTPHPLRAWLDARRALVADLAQALRNGFQAVAEFDAHRYLDSVANQDELTRRIATLDRKMPDSAGLPRPERAAAAEELSRMNAELKNLAAVHGALIERGGRSVRSFQRVWALGAAGYDPPEKK